VRYLALAVGLFALASTTCVRAIRHRTTYATGTCEGACRHYTTCKRTEDRFAFDGCMRECREIFMEDGELDTGSLKEFEQLDCPEVIAFVEGSRDGTPGEPHAGRPVVAPTTNR
jgi:hypothetical protein